MKVHFHFELEQNTQEKVLNKIHIDGFKLLALLLQSIAGFAEYNDCASLEYGLSPEDVEVWNAFSSLIGEKTGVHGFASVIGRILVSPTSQIGPITALNDAGIIIGVREGPTLVIRKKG